ncbi:MAG: ankyrin repeat domain-containing protein [Proteobacteria bacterium]|nr:ankyrin repeat domain-containing protein [Pseudomonadota bacterium]MBU1742275.1 ankyrin repeat domain-containing protein [Pseudomonadota bacterium]
MKRLVVVSLSVIILLTLVRTAPADRGGVSNFSRAVLAGDYDKVNRMLRANPSLARYRDRGAGQRHMRMTPLHWAATARRTRIARLLCTFGADPNARDIAGQTPLHYAAAVGAVGVIRVLLAWRANPNIRDIAGRTPMWHARHRGFAGAVAALAAAGGH